MKEKEFIKQNHKKWKELETLLANKESDPDQIANLFIQTTEDLSFSKTYYKNRSVRVYLNLLANKIFTLILKQKKGGVGAKFIEFWKEELPYILWSVRKDLLISFLFFMTAVSIGVFSSIVNDDFTSEVLGSSYVNMTEENIEKGDPMAVYKSMHQVDMFLGITYNNLRVATLTYISGLFAAIGSLLVMLHNGVMVGTFQYYFIEKGLFWESFLAIWLHGTIEISCIIIAGAAGLVLGKGWIFPSTYSRLQSLQIAANKSIKIMLGIAPLIVLAGMIESFLTRYTTAPDIIRLGLIIFSFLLIAFIFIINPLVNGKKFSEKYLNAIEPVQTNSNDSKIDLSKVKEIGLILKETVILYKNFFIGLFKLAFIISLSYAGALIWGQYLDNNLIQTLEFYDIIIGSINHSESMVISITGVNSLFLLLFISLKKLKKKLSKPTKNIKSTTIQIEVIWAFLASLVCNFSFFIPNILLNITTFILTLIFCSLWGTAIIIDGQNLKKALSKAFFIIRNGLAKIIGVNIIAIIISLFILTILLSPIIYFYLEIISVNIPFEGETKSIIMNTFTISITMVILTLVIPIITIANSIIYYSVLEEKNATFLLQEIDNIFLKKKKVFGMETE